MQAPHSPAPQPYFVPVSFSSSRITQSSGVSGGASVETDSSLSVNEVGINYSASRCTAAIRLIVTDAENNDIKARIDHAESPRNRLHYLRLTA